MGLYPVEVYYNARQEIQCNTIQYNTIAHITQNNIQRSWQRTPSPSKQVAADLALRLRGHWDRLSK